MVFCRNPSEHPGGHAAGPDLTGEMRQSAALPGDGPRILPAGCKWHAAENTTGGQYSCTKTSLNSSGRTGRADPGFGTGTGRRAAAPERGGARKRAHGADLRRRPGHRCCGGPGLLCGGLPRGGAVPQQCRGGGRAGSGAAGHHGRAVRCGQPGQLRAGVPCGGTGAGSGGCAGEQCRHRTAEAVHRHHPGRMAAHAGREPDRCVPPVPAGAAGHDPPQGGPHPDSEQYVGPDRRQLRSALFCRQSGPHRPDQGTGQRRRPQRHHGELCGTRGH